MKELLEKNNLLKPARIGDIIEGKVIGKERQALFLDLETLGTGIIYGKEFQAAKEELKNLKVGNNVFAKITDLENESGYVELSISQASQELVWEGLKNKKEKGELITIKVTGANRGGLLTEISGISAFLPVSQLLNEHYPRVEGGDASKILTELQNFIDKTLEVKIFDLSQRERKLILSEKAKEVEKVKEELKKYKTGDVVEGEITGITDFGVFVKFNDLEGLIHISELDWAIIEDPAEIVKVGQKLQAKIIEISGEKVSLSLKALKKDPWEGIEEKYKKGDTVSGKVTKFNPFGAFVQIASKIEPLKEAKTKKKAEPCLPIQGLCHISEFGSKIKMEEKLGIGKKYDFQILEIRPAEHRLTLKLVESR